MHQSRLDGDLRKHGFCMLTGRVCVADVARLVHACRRSFAGDGVGVLAKSSRGHVYAARNLIGSVPEVSSIWQRDPIRSFLVTHLGGRFGLVRALFFDKPPDRTWALAWHKDTSIAVEGHAGDSAHFSRPTTKAGVPHVIASDDILGEMLTLRIHLDEVTDENGPLEVIPGSHVSNQSAGVGVEHAVKICAAAGEVLAMRPLITHASGSSSPGTRRHRRILHLEFAASERLPDGYRWHDFVRLEEGQLL
ncbi:phytanoyl-CoA dioxygenase family protein [Roseiconus lacunae]|uniref:phytanoyl-CoA dioxygenase family protein n=1 Tax=Roseiconus lacunae TaxID=2605694 RepID=UPI001F1F2E22|nr:phytanoyl-CoA dioxygenase family protein [Roseiconus lacunae]